MRTTISRQRPSAGAPGQPDVADEAAGDKRPLRPAAKALVAHQAFLAACGLGGDLYLATNPLAAMPMHYLEGTWFHTWRWPGLALVFFVGVCPALAAGAALRRMPVALIGHFCVGIGLVPWIVLEATWVVVSPPLQIVMGLVGITIFALGTYEVVRHEPAT